MSKSIGSKLALKRVYYLSALALRSTEDGQLNVSAEKISAHQIRIATLYALRPDVHFSDYQDGFLFKTSEYLTIAREALEGQGYVF